MAELHVPSAFLQIFAGLAVEIVLSAVYLQVNAVNETQVKSVVEVAALVQSKYLQVL